MTRALFSPTDAQRQLVSQLTAFGAGPADICPLVSGTRGRPVSVRTLRRHFAKELAEGELRANSLVAQTLYRKALAGDTISMLFWLKCRAGWKETAQAVELTGANGGPVRVQSMSDAELEAIVAGARSHARRSRHRRG